MAIFNPFNITPYSLYKELHRQPDYYDREDWELEEALKEFNRELMEDNWSISPLGNLTKTLKLLDSISRVSTIFLGNSGWEAHLSKESLYYIQHTLITTLIRLHPNEEVVKKFYRMVDQDFTEERNSIISDWLGEYFEISNYKLSPVNSDILSKTKIDDRIIINVYSPDTIEILTEGRFKDMTKVWGDILNQDHVILSRYGYPQVLLHSMEEDL